MLSTRLPYVAAKLTHKGEEGKAASLELGLKSNSANQNRFNVTQYDVYRQSRSTVTPWRPWSCCTRAFLM